VLHELKPEDKTARLQYCHWLQEESASGTLDMNIFFMSDEAWFNLSGYINSQNSRYWSTENPHQFVETPLHAQKRGVWCAVSTRRIITAFSHLIVNSNRYVEEMFNPFVNQLTNEEKKWLLSTRW
jgi:hypothetical protein